MKVRKKFKTLGSLSAALKHYELPLPGFQHQSVQTDKQQPPYCDTATNTDNQTEAPFLLKQFAKLPVCQQIDTLDALFASVCMAQSVQLAPGYIQNSISAMHHLKSRGKSNVLAGAAFVLGTMRPDQSDR